MPGRWVEVDEKSLISIWIRIYASKLLNGVLLFFGIAEYLQFFGVAGCCVLFFFHFCLTVWGLHLV